jgi:hypothetical protein
VFTEFFSILSHFPGSVAFLPGLVAPGLVAPGLVAPALVGVPKIFKMLLKMQIMRKDEKQNEANKVKRSENYPLPPV